MTDIRLPTRDEIQARKMRLWGRVPVAKVEAKPEPVPIAPKRKRERLSPEMKILQRIADKHDVSVGEILGDGRAKLINEARFAAVYALATEIDGMSYATIGRIVNKDHSSIVHAVKIYARRHGLPVVDRSMFKGRRGCTLPKSTFHEGAAP